MYLQHVFYNNTNKYHYEGSQTTLVDLETIITSQVPYLIK